LRKTRNNTCFELAELAAKIGAELEGDGATVVENAAPIESARPGDISFVANSAYVKHIETTRASALVLDPTTPSGGKPTLRHTNPYLTFAKIVDLLYPPQRQVREGINKLAVIDDAATIDPSSGIGPLCHIREGVTIGRNCQLVSSVYVGSDVTIGNDCLFYPGVRIMDGCTIGDRVIIHASTVVGSDGFGYAETETGLRKIQQVGWVEIADDVEIGSNVSIDRGAIGPTRIGRGSKIDNLVQIAHNVEIGQHSIICGQTGISGSVKIGNGTVLAGQVGVVGHIDIGDGVKVGAQSGVSKSIPDGKTVFGYPARDIMVTKRIEAALTRLPDLLKRVKKLEDNQS